VTGRRLIGGGRRVLVSFLLARADEDEAVAVAAAAAIEQSGDTPLPVAHPIADHVARHDPQRALREVAAKRAVARLWLEGLTAQLNDPSAASALDAVETVLVELAAVYADHPEFRSSWLPQRRHPQAPNLNHRGVHPGSPRPGNVIPFRTQDGPSDAPH
jgi:hypothetical protein